MKVDACLSTGESKEAIYPNRGWDAAAMRNMGFPKGRHLLTFLFLEKTYNYTHRILPKLAASK